MSGLLERAASLFVAPSDARPARSRPAPPPPVGSETGGGGPIPSVAVLGAPADAVPVGRLLAAELRLRTGAGCVLLAEWREGAAVAEAGGVCPPVARRLVERLSGRGIEASARGRTVHLPLPGDVVPAVATLQRALATGGVPGVCVLAGPRPSALDPLLVEQALVVVAVPAGATDALAGLVVAGLEALRVPVVVSRPVPRGAARFLAASSVATARALGPAVTDAVRGLA